MAPPGGAPKAPVPERLLRSGAPPTAGSLAVLSGLLALAGGTKGFLFARADGQALRFIDANESGAAAMAGGCGPRPQEGDSWSK